MPPSLAGFAASARRRRRHARRAICRIRPRRSRGWSTQIDAGNDVVGTLAREPPRSAGCAARSPPSSTAPPRRRSACRCATTAACCAPTGARSSSRSSTATSARCSFRRSPTRSRGAPTEIEVGHAERVGGQVEVQAAQAHAARLRSDHRLLAAADPARLARRASCVALAGIGFGVFLLRAPADRRSRESRACSRCSRSCSSSSAS